MSRTESVKAVDIQHRGAEAVQRATEGLSREELAEYWAERTRVLRAEIEAARVAAEGETV